MKTLIDDFSVLAVEKCLVKRLPDLLSPNTVASLDDATVTKIASETEESILERSRTTSKLGILESALIMLRSLDRHKVAGEFVPLLSMLGFELIFPVKNHSMVLQPEELDSSGEDKKAVPSAEVCLPASEYEVPQARKRDDHGGKLRSMRWGGLVEDDGAPIEHSLDEPCTPPPAIDSFTFSQPFPSKKSGKKSKKHEPYYDS